MEDMVPFSGLRGVCAMAVFLGHQTEMFVAVPSAPWWRNSNNNNPQTVVIGLEYLQAISLFFLLSGIPLTRLYAGKVGTWQGICRFWRKRMARLVPIYYLTLALNLAVLWVISGNVDMKTTLASFAGCALFLQGWFVSLINVGGVLWQVAVFVFGYALFPLVVSRPIISAASARLLLLGILVLWLFSLALWWAFATVWNPSSSSPAPAPALLSGWWIWHVHCWSRLPHVMAGVLLGELVDRARRHYQENNDNNSSDNNFWSILTDALSLVWLGTAVQAWIVQWYYGTEVRSAVSIGMEAWLLPLHALWLAGIVLAFYDDSSKNTGRHHSATANDEQRNNGGTKATAGRVCWTRRVLSVRPLVALGDMSLALYCLHLVVLFLYTAGYAYATTGDWHLVPTESDYTFRVQVPWWHAPVQWALVIAVSWAVTKWFEAPLRRKLAGSSSGPQQRQPRIEVADSTESAALLPEQKSGLRYC